MTLREAILPYQSLKDFLIVCAVSGGVDSVVLLHALKSAGFNIVVAHINHQLRDQANEDEAFVQSLAAAYGYPCETQRIHINPQANIQNEGHQLRLSFYQDVAKKYNAQHVFLAHHQDDQLEHFFIQIARGFSELAWVGMTPSSKINTIQLIRPLLELDKETLIDYAKMHQLSFRHDASNDTNYYLRNRIRHTIIPMIKASSPGLIQRIIPALKTLKEQIETEKKQVLDFQENTFILDLKRFKNASVIQQKRWLHYLFESSTHLPPRSDRLWEMIIKRLQHDTSNVHFHLVEDWYLSLDYGVLSVVQWQKRVDEPILIRDFGKHLIDDGVWLDVSPQKKAPVSGLSVELCYNVSTFPIQVRTAKKGDILSFDYGHKKISQWFKDVKIPWGLRPQILVVKTNDGRLAVMHPSFPKPNEKCVSKVYIYEVKNAEQ